MYAVFEEVVGHRIPSVVHGVDLRECDQKEDNGRAKKTVNHSGTTSSTKGNSSPSSCEESSWKEEKNAETEVLSHYAPCGASPAFTRKGLKRSKLLQRRISEKPGKVAGHNDSDKTMSTSEQPTNPLLETISSLTYDPCDDSDDYCDLNGGGGDDSAYDNDLPEKTGVKNGVKPEGTDHRHGDGESIGYAGSNSIDSGYKSFCPTPEMPDSSVYSPNSGREDSSSSTSYSCYDIQGSSTLGRDADKNKSSGKNSARPTASTLPRKHSIRRQESNLYEVNLDHLMYLRQSLLSAIQQCEASGTVQSEKEADESSKDPTKSSKKGSYLQLKKFRDSSRTVSSSPAEKSRKSNPATTVTAATTTTTTPPVSSIPPQCTYQKTVRFNTDIKVSATNATKKELENSVNESANSPTNIQSKRKDKDLSSSTRSQAKSILKDPLCENLRSKLQSGNADCTLEEEIDSLLYGRAEFYDLESVEDFPCSYVTMIEEKYRSGKPSVAKVRKLKGERNSDVAKVVANEPQETQENEEEEHEDDQEKEGGGGAAAQSASPAKDSSVSRSFASAKCRFTEVARCMIEIIEDIHMKKLQSDSSSPTKDTTQLCQRTQCHGDHDHDDSEFNSLYRPGKSSVAKEQRSFNSDRSSYSAAADYHVYEEIAYDFVKCKKDNGPVCCGNKTIEVPPPLPARPTTMFQQKSDLHCCNNRLSLSDSAVISQTDGVTRRGRCLKKVREDRSVRNRPKQRSNLYSLFSDQRERRNISRSLEREWRVAGQDEPDDEYGFRKTFPSI